VSRNVTPAGFDDRDGWALKMQAQYALPIYREYWAIGGDDITEVDELGKTETAAKVMDCDGGADKVVTPATGIRYVAQRFRTRSESDDGYLYDPDFSIRTATYSDQDTEYDKLLNAHRNGGNVPAIYTFGVGDGVSYGECLDKGFREFYFLNLPRFLKLVDAGHLTPVASYPNGDGSEALYYDVDDLHDHNVVQDSVSGDVLRSAWRDDTTSNEFPTAPGIKTTGQVELFGFGEDSE
jgi:hypothetical protein